MEFKKPIYPIEQWNITETEFKKENNYRNETTFALSNGYIGTRGTFEEAYPFDVDTGLEGNFVNGFYESNEIRYGEANFGSPLLSQSLLNLPNLKEIHVILDGEEFTMEQGEVKEYARTLHMKDGILERKLTWTASSGKMTEIHIFRLVSFARKNIMAIRYQVRPVNYAGTVEFVSKMQADVENHTRKTNPIVDYGPFGRRLDPDKVKAENDISYYEGTTKGSHLTVACGSVHELWCDGQTVTNVNWMAEEGEMDTISRVSLSAKEGKCVTLDKFICYSTSLDMEKEKLEAFVQDELAAAKSEGYEKLKEQQKNYMQDFWKAADVEIKGNEELQQGLHFNLFHIIQSAGRDGKTGMGAKGLSGEGYEGHYFWDTEMYVLPVFVYTDSELAKQLLNYRYDTLDDARDRAKVLGHMKGALYPWRTINGKEASTYFPLGTAQYHINADIAYAFKLYLDITGDDQYLIDRAAEVLVETARVWADVGCFAECKDNKYCICSVTGPDEYNAIVDNNFYTNLMARENIRSAMWALDRMKSLDEDAYNKLVEKLELEDEELEYWERIINNMYFPFDEKLQIYPQDDGFMMRKPWDESKIPEEKRHLLYENYHPLFVYRQKMSKQADAILGMLLHSNFFTEEELKRNYDFYQTVTLHHSSLSTCIFGILASQIGYDEEAYKYFSQSARMDLDDMHDNFYAGIHAANMAGTWQGIVFGFAGVRSNTGELTIHPKLPEQWKSYEFCVEYHGSDMRIKIEQGKVTYKLLNQVPITFKSNHEPITLNKEGEEYVQEI